jgi:hypothetical protein
MVHGFDVTEAIGVAVDDDEGDVDLFEFGGDELSDATEAADDDVV